MYDSSEYEELCRLHNKISRMKAVVDSARELRRIRFKWRDSSYYIKLLDGENGIKIEPRVPFATLHNAMLSAYEAEYDAIAADVGFTGHFERTSSV